jgi:hypothetical protein
LERRQPDRHALNLQANFEWTDAEGIEHSAQGFTRDICSKGMFIYTDSPPASKADLQVEVVLSSWPFENKVPPRMRASALVVRVEPPGKPGLRGGFAAVNKSYDLLRGEAVIERWIGRIGKAEIGTVMVVAVSGSLGYLAKSRMGEIRMYGPVKAKAPTRAMQVALFSLRHHI